MYPAKMWKFSKNGFTLVELFIVIFIVGILATLSYTQYNNFRGKAISREAQANLRLIRAAERIYQSEWGGYYATAGNDNFTPGAGANFELRLDLNDSGNWDYDLSTGGGGSTFTATASRGACVFNITQADDNVGDNGSCP